MNTLIIEINDYKLTLIQGDTHVSEFGYALIADEEVLFGEQAWQLSKTSPLNMHYHYWQRLGYEDVNTTNSKIKHFADLAFLQLQRLTAGFSTCQDIIFVVPPYYNNEQLSLLLGIAKACKLSVSAIVNNAIAYLAETSFSHNNQSALFFDIELHQTICTELTTNNVLAVSKSQVIANQGVHNLYHTMAKWINKKLIDECRFDGFYTAETEQEIYQVIPTLLTLEKDQYDINIADKNIMVNINEVREILDNFFHTTLSSFSSTKQCFITRRFANLLERLTVSSEQDFIVIDQHSLTHNLHKLFDVMTCDKDIRLITQIQLNTRYNVDSSTDSNSINNVNNASVITHVLINGCAYPLISESTDVKKYYLSEKSPYLSHERTNHSNITLVSHDQYWRIENLSNDSIYLNRLPLNRVQDLVIGDKLTSKFFKQPLQFIHVNREC